MMDVWPPIYQQMLSMSSHFCCFPLKLIWSFRHYVIGRYHIIFTVPCYVIFLAVYILDFCRIDTLIISSFFQYIILFQWKKNHLRRKVKTKNQCLNLVSIFKHILFEQFSPCIQASLMHIMICLNFHHPYCQFQFKLTLSTTRKNWLLGSS